MLFLVNTVKIQEDPALQNDMSVRWPNGVVRYYVDERSYDNIFGVLMESAIQIIHRRSCIQFMRMEDIDKSSVNMSWIHITNPRKERKCNHEPRFMDNLEIELVFGYDCLKTKDMLHTLLHGIGIKDEVTHPHRDKYIRVLWDNIHPAYQHLYRKQEETPSKILVEYDPLSVMQFHDRAFSRNGRATIVPLEPGLVISPSETLSQLDQMRLQMYFGHECNKRKVSNLLKSCKKSFKEERGKEHSDIKMQDANNSDLDYSADDTVSIENISSHKEATNVEDEDPKYITMEEVIQDDAGNASEKKSDGDNDYEDIKGVDTDDDKIQYTEGQEDEEGEDKEGQGVEGQAEEGQDKEGQDEEGQNKEAESKGTDANIIEAHTTL
ncbi:zinc metalloproteinase nas-6-like [Pararge aegeria]|uniref:zinc metalloproteinase nas-6-like n=1 Tax=Pararge aegeria TaxID=116150 RepID=UPI0019CFB3FC|nr:zinc metalloproteinase nas-6-like [Pararge aegeria]